MYERGAVTHRRLGVDHGRQWLVVDADGRSSVGRGVRVRSHHRGDRLADVADLTARERRLGARGVQAHVRIGRVRVVRGQRLLELGKVAGDEHGDAGERAGGGGVDGHDSRPSVRGTHDRDVETTGRRDIVDEPPAPGDEPLVLPPTRRLPDHAFSLQ